ncbi:MAG: endopeptidase La, partial [Oscillospiraceae bacterium]|nr:endopeptidase La [Oscillospiraceae bacterium]
MTRSDIRFSDKALYRIIDDYTVEAGVRNLERSIAKVMRKAAKMLSESETAPIKVTDKNMDTFLGVPYNRESIASQEDSVGIVNGLAWTSAGGTLLPIEAVVIPGTGRLEITGSLGDVMKESIKLAITYGRTLTGAYKFPEKFLNEYDIHVHAPEGAVPKDGPSAGVTIATALVSAVCRIPVRKDVAMTGEITLQGRVLAIGGLKEKLIAAHKEKIHTVVIPASNIPDLQDIPDEVRDTLEIIPVKRIDEVLEIALKK